MYTICIHRTLKKVRFMYMQYVLAYTKKRQTWCSVYVQIMYTQNKYDLTLLKVYMALQSVIPYKQCMYIGFRKSLSPSSGTSFHGSFPVSASVSSATAYHHEGLRNTTAFGNNQNIYAINQEILNQPHTNLHAHMQSRLLRLRMPEERPACTVWVTETSTLVKH